MIKKYLKNIAKTSIHDDQREESYYPAIASLMSEFADLINKKEVTVTILPKKTEAGNPDFRIWDGNNKIVGYIEAKIPNTDLNRVEVSEQLVRYLSIFPNVILTDFYEFRLYRNGELIEKVSIGRPFIAKKLKTLPPLENKIDFEKLLQKFFDFSLPKIFTAETLAIELAKRTRFLRDEIITIELQKIEKKNYIRGFYDTFKKYLISGLKKDEFADLYSQTITYGMFAAKTRTKHNTIFNRKNAITYIPQTIGVLQDIFKFISLGKLPLQMEVIIDDIAEVLNVADASKLLNDYYKQGKGDDPIIHFYETFLNRYDPNTREKRGVFYTPESVVKYIVNSVNEILIKNFNKIGFADNTIKVLDPAGGTLTFLAEATKIAISTFSEYYGDGDKNGFIKRHILKNFYGFELMMSPYAIAHIKMSYLLQEQGYTLQEDDRFQLYLTNTLDSKQLEQIEIPLMDSISEESEKANIIKKDTEILAIIGNPPYSFDSANKKLYLKEMEIYKKNIENEKNLKILADDYIKFIRFCHKKIEQTKQGVISLITKNTYLNIAAAKGMRKQLLLTFDKIYILNLHGKLYEKTPKDDKDENVFDIRVGTAIMFLIKNKKRNKKEFGKLYYKDLFGSRDFKYSFLNKKNIFSTFTQKDEIEIDKTHFFFEKKDFKNQKLYNKFFSIDEIFNQKAMGVSTHRDHFVIDENKKRLENRLRTFLNSDLSQKQKEQFFEIKDNRDFKVANLINYFDRINNEKFKLYAYKPFETKFIYYDNKFIDYDRISIMHNFIDKENIGLVINRRQSSNEHSYVFVSDKITDFNFLGVGSYTIPLWIYKQNGDAFNGNGKHKNKISNIKPKFEELLQNIYSKKDITKNIFYYVYAILYSNIYRKSFSELLKIDYSKIPFPSTLSKFEAMADLGNELADLHLFKSSKKNKPQVKFQGQGNGKIEKPKFAQQEERIYINSQQYFSNIKLELWEFHIGKNQVLKRWLKRKENVEFEDAVEFSQIATIIYETFKKQNEIDEIYSEIIYELIENC